eukprot:SAG25_NODE_4940_length_727_cov_0.957006_1_plen_82_part_10
MGSTYERGLTQRRDRGGVGADELPIRAERGLLQVVLRLPPSRHVRSGVHRTEDGIPLLLELQQLRCGERHVLGSALKAEAAA